MKNLTLTTSLALSLLITVSSLYAAGSPNEHSATLTLTAVDEHSAVVPDAPVSISGEHKTRFVGGKEIPGTTTMSMAQGDYRISSAIIKKTGDYLDRFASHEAHVHVTEGDNTTVVLHLRPINDPDTSLSYAEVHKMGVPSDIAKSFN